LNIVPHLAHLALGEIKPATIRSWRAKLLKAGRSEIQAVKAYRILRAVFNTAVKEDELVKVNPCRIKGFDKERAPERPVPTVTQVQALAEEMPARFYALILLAAYSGLRWGELTALRRMDLNVKSATVRVHRKLVWMRGKPEFGPPKSEAGKRTVSLPKAAVEVMKHHLAYNMDGEDGEELLFKGVNGAPLQTSNFRRAVDWNTAIKAAGLGEDFHFHDLRHLGNQLAANAGASTRELMHRLGQSTVNAAMIYQHATRKRDREIAAGIDEALTQGAADDEDSDNDDGLAGVPARAR
jgi:integrase